MTVYCVMESFCGDDYSLRRVFAALEDAEAYMLGLQKEDEGSYNSYYISEEEVY